MSTRETTVERHDPVAPAPLLAVCGVAGGAGTSTLALLTAMQAQRSASRPVLLCDSGGPAASLALLAGTHSPISLPAATRALAADALTVPVFAALACGLRLIATDPQLDDDTDPEGLDRLLCDARKAHPLTVVDCGTLQRSIERSIAAQASSVLWVTEATQSGARRTEAVFRSLPTQASREVLAVRVGEQRDGSVEHRLMRAAESRRAALVFVPSLPDVQRAGVDAALEVGQLALEAIRGRLA